MQAVYTALKERHRSIRDDMPDPLTLRIHRALSWLQRAAQCDDPDGRFIFLWIAFNAAYAHEIAQGQRLSEQEAFRSLLKKLNGLDADKQLEALVWQECSGPIRVLLGNPYVFESFGDFHRGELSEEQWQERLTKGKQRANRLLEKGDTPELLARVFQRIYTLHNQLMHGGATWNSQINRVQVQGCANIMSKLVPVLIDLMMSNPDTIWGEACYPVVSN